MGYTGNGKSGSSSSPSPAFNRSMPVHSSPPPVEDKPSYGLHNSLMFQRNGSIKNSYAASNSFHGKVKKLCSIFEAPKHRSSDPTNLRFSNSHSHSISLPFTSPTKSLRSQSDSPNPIPRHVSALLFESPIKLPGTEDRVVIYFTSLRGIRRTFQDCHSVRMIFRGFHVCIDERDISMDAAYKRELQKVMGQKNVSLPQVFIKGSYIGGADLIKQLVEVGELRKLVMGLPPRAMKPCDACNDMRFIPCTNCNGSRKVFDDEEDEDQPRRCLECNENGLMRCPLCCL